MMVITDHFTKWAECYPLKDEQYLEVAACLADRITKNGAPLSITSDRGRNFLAKLIDDFCIIWGIDHYLAASYHPQANAKVERLNGTLCDMIRPFCKEAGSCWDENIGALNVCLKKWTAQFY